MKKIAIETKIGIFAFFALIILASGIIWKSSLLLRVNGYQIEGAFNTVSGLLVGSEVRYRGYLIGSVSQIIPGPEDIRVYMFVKRGVNIPIKSKLRVGFDGLIGEKYISVLPSREHEFIKKGDVLEGYAAKTLVDFVHTGTLNLMETKKILKVLGDILTNGDSKQSLKDMIVNFGNISGRLDTLIGNFNTLLSEDNTTNLPKKIDSILNGLELLLNNLNLVFTDDGLSENQQNKGVTQIMANLKKFTKNINSLTLSLKEDKGNITKKIHPILDQTQSLLDSTESVAKATHSSIKQTKIELEANILNNKEYEISNRIILSKNVLEMSIGNKADINDKISLKSLMFGKKIGDNAGAYIGLLNFQPGIKVDYKFNEDILIESRVYDPKKIKAQVHGKFRLLDSIKALLGIDYNTSESAFIFGLGIN